MKAMKKFKTIALCTILSGSLLFSSCIGSFGLWNTLKNWNENTGNKFVNEIVFLAFHIIPVYEFAYLADIIVLNSIEFWTGSNPVAEVGNVKTIKGENGEYLVQTNENGYTIIKKGEENKPLDLVYNEEQHTWNAEAEGHSYEIIKMNEDGSVTFKLQDGTPATVMPDAMGVATAQAALQPSK